MDAHPFNDVFITSDLTPGLLKACGYVSDDRYSVVDDIHLGVYIVLNRLGETVDDFVEQNSVESCIEVSVGDQILG